MALDIIYRLLDITVYAVITAFVLWALLVVTGLVLKRLALSRLHTLGRTAVKNTMTHIMTKHVRQAPIDAVLPNRDMLDARNRDRCIHRSLVGLLQEGADVGEELLAVPGLTEEQAVLLDGWLTRVGMALGQDARSS
jgi:hypothetical protein